MRVLLLGASGTLGTELQKHVPKGVELLTPSHEEWDILKLSKWKNIGGDTYFAFDDFDIVIHAAAMIDNRKCEKEPEKAIHLNIIGTSNVAIYCIEKGIRLVYISTDYCYPGDRGNYLESDPVNPFNLYAWTKLGGECSVKAVKNHLIIRTSFGKNEFEYKEAFVDKWSSKDYVDIIAPMIMEAALSPLTGVLNLGTERKTLFSHARERNDDVKGVKIKDTNHATPYDTSLNIQRWIDYKNESPVAKPHSKCRCCGGDELIKYLDLGLMPLANNLEFTAVAARNAERYPLQVMLCKKCYLSQLSVIIDPVKMYSYYTYRSSINQGYVNHCYELMISLQTQYVKEHEFFHIDIAGNDGTLLKEALKVNEELHNVNYKVLNIDPAKNLCALSEANGVHALSEFWRYAVGMDHCDTVDLITATNVFAHVDDIEGFLKGARAALKLKGVLVLEFPYLINFIEGMEFDTVYFEHLSYMSLRPIVELCNSIQLDVIDCRINSIHGGSLQVTICHEMQYKINQNVYDMAHSEYEGYQKLEVFKEWGTKVQSLINDFGIKILELKKSGAKIGAFAASAKGNTLLNSAGINTDLIDFIADETPEKIGKFSPGTGIPIVNKDEIMRQNPDYIVVLSWNFAFDIIKKIKAMGFKGKFIIPIPEFKIMEDCNDIYSTRYNSLSKAEEFDRMVNSTPYKQ